MGHFRQLFALLLSFQFSCRRGHCLKLPMIGVTHCLKLPMIGVTHWSHTLIGVTHCLKLFKIANDWSHTLFKIANDWSHTLESHIDWSHTLFKIV